MLSENAYITLVQNGVQKEVYNLSSASPFTIGRSYENAISLPDDKCSRHHAKIFFEDTQWFIQDLGSRNGTLVDGTFVNAGIQPLVTGSLVQIGQTVFQFWRGEYIMPQTAEADHDDHLEGTNNSGVLGISSENLARPSQDHHTALTEIIHQRGFTSILKPDADTKRVSRMVTNEGHGALELCRLAYSLAKAEEVDQVSKIAIQGLLKATGAEGAGLWLFPYSLKSEQQASDIRLVANAVLRDQQYRPVSESIVREVFERKEAFLMHEATLAELADKEKGNKRAAKEQEKLSAVEKGHNMLAAPIRYQSTILGLLHLYTQDVNKTLNEDDLEYTLAVADTVGVALTHINREKKLTANLNQTRSNLNKAREQISELLQKDNEIVGSSSQMQGIHHLIARAAEGKATVLIRGESGVGKELIARAVHFASPRKGKPLVCLNCAAISESLLASELFGHEKGSFTGATERKIGKFEAAHTGTLFLDEIGEMSPALQAKFLRVLEGSSFERVGGNTSITVDVRVIAATNRDLEKEVSEGRFRHDLFFRLRVLEIVVPPLRKRLDDIPILAQHFLDRFCKETGRKFKGLDANAMHVLMTYRWPGNIRELKNVMERAVVLGTEPYVQEQDLLLSHLRTAGESDIQRPDLDVDTDDVFVPLSMEDVEKNHILRTLEHLGWNKSLTAKQLGIERTTLDRKIKRYGLEKE